VNSHPEFKTSKKVHAKLCHPLSLSCTFYFKGPFNFFIICLHDNSATSDYELWQFHLIVFTVLCFYDNYRDGLEDPLDDSGMVTQQLDQMSVIARCEYGKTCQLLVQLFNNAAQNYQEMISNMGTSKIDISIQEGLYVVVYMSWSNRIDLGIRLEVSSDEFIRISKFRITKTKFECRIWPNSNFKNKFDQIRPF